VKPGIQVECGLRPEGPQDLAEATIVLHSDIPALHDFLMR
jgi:hypothetical protein